MSFDARVFKAYDVRGLYPEEVNETLAEQIGRAFVAYTGARRIAVSRDMRLSSPTLTKAFIEGALTQGADVVDIGLNGTDQMYFAVARDDHDGGAQITASHNPGQYNGIKLVGRQALPLSGDAGISDIRDMLLTDAIPAPAASRGRYSEADVFEDYIEHVLTFIDLGSIKPFSLVLDAGCGMAGRVRGRGRPPVWSGVAVLAGSTGRIAGTLEPSAPSHAGIASGFRRFRREARNSDSGRATRGPARGSMSR